MNRLHRFKWMSLLLFMASIGGGVGHVQARSNKKAATGTASAYKIETLKLPPGCQSEIGGVTLLGKPDLRYITKEGVHVICDWKVNGSTSKYGASPFKGYAICRDFYESNTHGKCHKGFSPVVYKDVIHDLTNLEIRCDYWADQLAIYSWLLGEKVGSEDYVVRMEQIACRPVKTRDLPRAKFATHMNKIGECYQNEVMARAAECWATIQSGHIFTDLDRADSDERCELLDGQAAIPVGLHPVLDKYKNEEVRFK